MTTRKWGSEFTVNTLTGGSQDQPAVTALADGGFMVAWRDANPTTTEIKMQRYDALGNPVGGEFLPSENTAAQSGSNADLVQLADGTICVEQGIHDRLRCRRPSGDPQWHRCPRPNTLFQ